MQKQYPKYKIKINEYASIPYNKTVIRTPKEFYILNDINLLEWKILLKAKGIKDYIIEDINKSHIKQEKPKKKELKLKSKIPPRPSRLK